MKKIFAFVLCMMLILSQMICICAESSENPLDWNFYSLSYAYLEDGVQKHYNPSNNTLSDELIAQIRAVLKDTVKNPTPEKPDNLGFRRISVTFCNTDKPNEKGNDHIRYTYDLCDNGIRITKKNAVWTDLPDWGEELAETEDETTGAEYVLYTDSDASRKIGELLNAYMGGNAVYPDFEFISNFKFEYEASIFLHNIGTGTGLYQWGICTYELGGVTHTAAYLIDNAIYLAPISETNKIHFDGVTRFVPRTSNKEGLNGYFYESTDLKDTLSADLTLTLNDYFDVTDVSFSITNKNFPDGRTTDICIKDIYNADGTIRSGIDSYQEMDGTLSFIDGFSPSPKAEDPEKEPAEEKKDDEKKEEEATTSMDEAAQKDLERFLSLVAEAPLRGVTYDYTHDGNQRSVSISETDFEISGKEKDVRELLYGYNYVFTKDNRPDGRTICNVEFRFRGERKDYAIIYMYENAAYVSFVYEENGQKIIGRYRFDYKGTPLTDSFAELFADEIDADKATPHKPTVSYTDLSKLNRRSYAASFTVSLTPEQENTWIGDYAENGKVRLTVSYFYSDANNSMVTISGNGKTYHLMCHGRITKNNQNKTEKVWYSTTKLGVQKDDDLPMEPARHGSLSVNWDSGPRYTVVKSPQLEIYDKPFYSKTGTYGSGNVYEASTEPVGGPILITEKEPLVTDPDEIETPVSDSQETVTFDDVPATHWAYTPIHRFYRATLVNGVGNNLFAPENAMTYEHFAFLLSRIFDYDAENISTESALRQDVFVSLVKAMGWENKTVKNEEILEERFTDAGDIRPENRRAVQIAVENGLVQGNGDHLMANSTLTRAECVTLLSRSLTPAFGITEQDAPETYKFKIYRSEDKYKTVTASDLFRFEIKNSKESEVLVKSADRMEGTAQITFGKDPLKDVRAIALCKVDKDIYTIEAVNCETMYPHTSINDGYKDVYIECTLNIYKNGKLIKTLVSAVIDYESFEEYLTIKDGGCSVVFHKTTETDGIYPNGYMKPEPEEKFYANFMVGEIGLGLGKGRELEIGYDSDISGNLVLRHNNLRTEAEVNSTFTATDIHGMNNTYQLTLSELTSMTKSELSGTFTILKNGLAWETVTGKLTKLDAGVGNHMYFVSDDAVWNIEFTITEIGKNN